MVEEGLVLGTFPAPQGVVVRASERIPSNETLAIRELARPMKPRRARKVYRSTMYFRHRSSRSSGTVIGNRCYVAWPSRVGRTEIESLDLKCDQDHDATRDGDPRPAFPQDSS